MVNNGNMAKNITHRAVVISLTCERSFSCHIFSAYVIIQNGLEHPNNKAKTTKWSTYINTTRSCNCDLLDMVTIMTWSY